jgi:PleD family two-component response regulator
VPESIARARAFLTRGVVLLVEPKQFGESILMRILNTNGAKSLHRFDTIEGAREFAAKRPVDLVVVNASEPAFGGYDFVKWFRTEAVEAGLRDRGAETGRLGHPARSDAARLEPRRLAALSTAAICAL